MPLASFSRLFARRFLAFVTLLTATAAALVAQTPSAADGFNPDVDGNVYVLLAQPDGKVLIGGQFSVVAGVERKNLARLNIDGTLDTSFNPTPNGPVRAIVLQPDNRILIGGDFTTLQPGATGTATTRNRVARLAVDGTVDAAFNPNIGSNPQLPLLPQVYALLVQPNGQVVIGGAFGTVGGATRNNLARVGADGALDTSFNPAPNGMVAALALHVNNKILVGGGFTALTPQGDSGVSGRNRIARLNPNGTVDSEFNPNANNAVSCIAVQRDGKVVIGGTFTTVQPPNEEGAANRTHIARLNVNGTVDSEFYPRAEGDVTAIGLQADGSLLVGGTFTTVWGRGSASIARSFLARFGGDGSLDTKFTPFVNAAVDAFAFQADGRVIIGGHFTRVAPLGSSASIVRNHLARLNSDGSFDTTLELDAGGRTLVSVTQTDGKVVIGGTFTSVGGATHNYLARLNADGSVDAAYAPDLNGRVYAMLYDAASNKTIIAGAFTTINGESRNHIARMNPNGTIDSEFNPNIDGQVGAMAVQSDGKIIVGGTFTTVFPIGSTATTSRPNLLRLNPNGTLDTTFDPEPNSSITSIAVQSDGKILVGGLFSLFTPGFASNTSATSTTRAFFARLNADGTVDTNFNPGPNAQVSTIALQSDGKIIIGGVFTTVTQSNGAIVTRTLADGTTTTAPPDRNRIARLNSDGTLDTAYNPNANGLVLTSALQSDGKLLIGGTFTTLQPNADTVFTLRKYAARLNSDGSVDTTFNLDIDERSGNRVDSLRIQSDGRVLIGGSFTSLQPAGSATRLTRANFARLTANGVAVDATFDASAGGATTAIVKGIAVQPDNKVIVVGDFSDLGGAKSTNIARFRPEGAPDPDFSNTLTTDGPVNAVAFRPNGAAVPSQVAGLAWLTSTGTLRSGFAATARLSGEVRAIAVLGDGSVLIGGAFTSLDNLISGNLARFTAAGVLDTSFNPAPNGAVSGIAVQADGRILIVGAFTTVGGQTRNHIARIDPNGAVDVTYDPNASGNIHSIVLQSDGLAVVGGAFTSFTPNFTTTVVTRNYLARVNVDGTIDSGYYPTPNYNVNSLTIQGDGKVIAGGGFTTVQPNGGETSFTRNSIARFNTDGTLDQNFDPNANSAVNTVLALPNGQILVGGSFTTLQPNQTGTVYTRNNLARVNSDGKVDQNFDPNANGAVTSLAVQADGSVLVGGTFTTLQPNGAPAGIARNHFARIAADGTLDVNFNPDVNGSVAAIVARPDGTILVGGNFADLQLNGSIFVAGSFQSVGGVPARNLASLNENGSVNTGFQPRPDGAVNAVLIQPDGKAVVGGEFNSIAGATRRRIARFNADGSLDTAFAPNFVGAVTALALDPSGKILVAGGALNALGSSPNDLSTVLLARLNADGTLDRNLLTTPGTGSPGVILIAPQADGKILIVQGGRLRRLNTDGSADGSFATLTATSGSIDSIALQADGRIVVSGNFVSSSPALSRLARLNTDGSVDTSFSPAPNGRVTAVAIQSDGRVVAGGQFTTIGGQPRVGLARLAATSPASQILGVAANRSTVMWNRGGTATDVYAVIFEQSADRVTWTRLGNGTRVAGSANWQLAGLNLPGSGLFYIRARGLAGTSGTSSGLVDSVREFTFSGPVIGTNAAIATDLAVGSAAAFDAYTGIVPRVAAATIPGEGTLEIVVASAAQVPANAQPARLANLSTRGRVTADNPLLLGFAIAGTESRRVLVRAVGPGLNGFGVAGALPATRLQVYGDSGAQITSNEGWGNSAELAQAATATGAFPLTAGSADSAAVLTLKPGNYTIQVVDTRGTGGVALAEIYDAGTGTASRLVNVSTRGAAGTGGDALISGFVIAGDLSQRVLLRGVGPGLTRLGATGAVADPSIALFDAQGRELGSNDNWVSSVSTVATATTAAGAFPLDAGSKDAAVLATLPSGVYTIQVSAPTTGTALLEVYEVR